MKLVRMAFLALLSAAAAESGSAEATIERFALVVGANHGGTDRPALRYAVADADRFARVLAELGGVRPGRAIVLKQPKLGELDAALDELRVRVSEARRDPAIRRTELLLYYSGHADEKGLLLGEDRYSYRSLRDRLDQVPADVRIAVLDACASGAITRLKGGQPQPPFMVDESMDMRGRAILTSSAATEAAQESDRIQGSYFTHYLVSGLRGAADLSGEGRVTLNEAYQFAFGETLGRTVDTKGGAQHPSYDINLSGTGDVVMTDLRQTSAALVIGENVDGRCFVRNERQELVVELYKPLGRAVELGLEPGIYEVHLERGAIALVAKPQLAEGARVVLDAAQFTATTQEATQIRGKAKAPPFAVAGRNRLDLRFGFFGMTDSGPSSPVVVAGNSATNVLGGLRYSRFLREDLVMTLGADLLAATNGTTVSSLGVSAGDTAVSAVSLGVRWNPAPGWKQAVKPYLDLSIGPVIGASNGTSVSGGGSFAGNVVEVSVGGVAGGGVDFHVSRGFSLGASAGYRWMADFSRPIGSRDNYSGFELALNIGWLFGAGSPVHE
jgi:uncharacterized caspase-like protein